MAPKLTAPGKTPPNNGARKTNSQTPSLRDRIWIIEKEMNAIFPEREEVVRGLLIGLLARQHVFLIGPPGTAKSAIVEMVRHFFEDDLKFFGYLMTKFTEPGELFGPYDYSKFMKGEMVRVVEGFLPTAHIVFFDEIFKSSSAILNSLLMALDERRRVKFGNTEIELPHELCVGASNELPQGEELSALYDRFLLKFSITSLKNTVNFTTLMKKYAANDGLARPATKVTIDELREAQEEIKAVKIANETIHVIFQMRQRLESDHSIKVSDRRWMQCTRLLKAVAWLRESDTALPEDCEVLRHALWTTPGEIEKVRGVVRKMCDPVSEEMFVILEQVIKEYERAMKSSADKAVGMEVNRILQESRSKLVVMYKSATLKSDKARLTRGISFTNHLNETLANVVMGVVQKKKVAPTPAYQLLAAIKDGSFAEELEMSEDEFEALIGDRPDDDSDE